MKYWLISLWLAMAPTAVAQVRDIALPPAEARDAEVHVMLVRHAYPACGDLDCTLTDEGFAQAAELALHAARARAAGLELVGVFSSSTCRTVLTATPSANDADLPVLAYPASDTLGVCGFLGPNEAMQRPTAAQRPNAGLGYAMAPAATRTALMDAIAQSAERAHRRRLLYIVVDHSNFVCTWFARFNVPEGDYAGECSENGLALTDYADIYWLYDTDRGPGEAWRMRHFENAFDRGIPNPFEQQQ